MKQALHTYFSRTAMVVVTTLLTHFAIGQTGYYGPYFTHIANAASLSADYTTINNPATNATSGSTVIIYTPNWAASGTGVYNNFASGLWYFGNFWNIYNEIHGSATIPVNSGYNILKPNQHGTAFQHTVTSPVGDNSVITNAACDGKPGVLLFVSHTYNTSVYDTSVVGVYYTGSNWAIYHENQTSMQNNNQFNVFVADTTGGRAFIHHATAGNSTSDYTIIDNPLTNGQPTAQLIITHNWSPTGWSSGSVYNTSPLGVFYTGGKWAIFNQNLTAIPANSGYNVLVTNINPATPSAIDEVGANVTALNAYPNPTSDKVSLSYSLNSNAEVSVRLYDLSGRMVADVYNGKDAAGSYTLEQNVAGIGAGMYYYVVTAGSQSTRTALAVVR